MFIVIPNLDNNYVSPLLQTAKTFIAKSDAMIKLKEEKVQQLLSENQTLRSQLALSAPVKTEALFSKISRV